MARPQKKYDGSVRKKYNKLKQLTRVADHLIKDKVICYTSKLAGCVVLDTKKFRIVPPESLEGKQVVAALSRPHKWSCYISVFGRTHMDEYMKGEQIFAGARYFQEDLAPTFEQHHGVLIKKVPEHHRCGVGWIADPSGADITEKMAGHIFQQLGAWDD